MNVGQRLGSYEITGAIGAGGMGEVFRARDTKLHRDVAIKVLPEAFAHDHERLARFTREAQTLASLNHPNIAAIHGIEEVPAIRGSGPGSRALVMELVEGEDLSAHIARGPLPIAERRFPSHDRSRKPSKPRTSTASSIATSSPRTSKSAPMARSRCSTSVSRRRWSPRARRTRMSLTPRR